MAVKLEFANLIIPNANIARAYGNDGGFQGFLDHLGSWDMIWHDEHLCRAAGSMGDLDTDIAYWERRGLVAQRDGPQGQQWCDFCVANSLEGPIGVCDWLVYDAADNCVYLAGTAKGKIIGPRR